MVPAVKNLLFFYIPRPEESLVLISIHDARSQKYEAANQSIPESEEGRMDVSVIRTKYL